MPIISHADTICAIATPAGDGGIGIVKISGPEALSAVLTIFQPCRPRDSLQSHRIHYGLIRDPQTGQVVDEVLVSYMAAPRSYTCEDVVEINCHSGFAVLNHIVELVLRSGVRTAAPGEFTRRAFLNGRIDLSQAEAVIDVIRSNTDRALQIANTQLQGRLRRSVESWRNTLMDFRAEMEAHMDFAEDMEEEGVPDFVDALPRKLEKDVLEPMAHMLSRYEMGCRIKNGLTMVLAGKPNVGKSSLLNGLLGWERAIVTPHPGTTRDVIEDSFVLGGIRFRILDTAGIRRDLDDIEALGVQRSMDSIQRADVVLWVVDGSRCLDEEDDLVFRATAGKRAIVVFNKSDLPPETDAERHFMRYSVRYTGLSISALSHEGIQHLLQELKRVVLMGGVESCESLLVTELRHKECLESARSAVESALDIARGGGDGALVCMELDSGRRWLDSLLGLVWEDDVLDRIFSRFCIGK